MPLNLITDPWIPIRCKDGSARVIAPWQMADNAFAFPDWPRADLNVACLEFLIGLVFLADPPEDEEDWQDRQAPDPERLKARLAPLAEAFELLGDGPRFMQDLEALEGAVKSLDMLFIDSAGESAITKNADLMVWRDRYPFLSYPLAAIALFTLQAFASEGGAGNRTSMRGGGPMVTLIDPGQGLWSLIWANVPDGEPGELKDLPWMRATRTSEKSQEVHPMHCHPIEAFFGMPRRLRLVESDGSVSGVIQRKHGTNYAGWVHPLSPYYRMKAGSELLPKHPKAGGFGYRKWLGVVVAEPLEDKALTQRAEVVERWHSRSKADVDVIVAGWAMSSAKPLDFIFARQPLLPLDDHGRDFVRGMILAADQLSLALRASLAVVLAEGKAREAVREEFYLRTEPAFERLVTGLSPSEAVAREWVAEMRGVALALFEARALPGLSERDSKEQAEVVSAHGRLRANLRGQGSYGKKAFAALELEAVK